MERLEGPSGTVEEGMVVAAFSGSHREGLNLGEVSFNQKKQLGHLMDSSEIKHNHEEEIKPTM